MLEAVDELVRIEEVVHDKVAELARFDEVFDDDDDDE